MLDLNNYMFRGDFMTEKEIEYLKKQKVVFIPKDYTFWVHNASYNLPENKGKYENSWESIPTKDFYVKKALKCVSAYDMMRDMVHHKRKEPKFNYIASKDALPFSIIIIQPRHEHLKEMCPKAELALRLSEEDGLGDFRQPKIADKTHLIVFACKRKDEAKNKKDMIFAIREQDVSDYVAELRDMEQQEIKIAQNVERWGFEINKERGTVKETELTKVLFKDKDFAWFEDLLVGAGNNKIVLPAPYKQEMMRENELAKKQEQENALKATN